MSSPVISLARRLAPRRAALAALAAACLVVPGLGAVASAQTLPRRSGLGLALAQRPGLGTPAVFVTNSGNDSLTEYNSRANSHSAPVATISGFNTGMRAPTGVAVDASGHVFVANARQNSVTEYAPGASGNSSPIATISGPNTGLSNPQGIALDASGNLFVVNLPRFGGGTTSITEYASGANGNVAPIATISGPNTELPGNSPFGIALDPSGDVFVSLSNNSIVEFAPGANGNVAPIATISGPNTLLNAPNGLAIHAGTLYVANTNNTVTEYPLASVGPGTNDISPSAEITGSRTGLSNPQGIAVDASGNIFVANLGTSSGTEYGSNANGDTAPIGTLSVGVNAPIFVAVPPTPSSTVLSVATPSSLPVATVGSPYHQFLAATGGAAPYRWSILHGSLPAGLTLNPDTGEISGTPTATATSNFTVQVTDSASSAASTTKALTIAVKSPVPLTITTSRFPPAIAGTFYRQTLAATGGTAPYTWSITAGSLPAGLTLNSDTGEISGTPTAAGTSSFTVQVTDSESPAVSFSKNISITVMQPSPQHGQGEIVYVANCGSNTITEYPAGASGDVAPVATIAGPATGLNCPTGLALGPAGVLYVANFFDLSCNSTSCTNSITEYAPGANGNVAPIRTISGPATNLVGPTGISLDSEGHLFVSNWGFSPVSYSVNEYAPGANGNVAPIAVITGPATGLNQPENVAISPEGAIFVANFAGNNVTEYPPGSNGNVAPIATIPAGHPIGITFDRRGNLLITSKQPSKIIEYVRSASGTYIQRRVISGPATGLGSISMIALDREGNIFATDFFLNTVSEFRTGASGNVAPIAVIAGPNTGLSTPQGIAIGPS